MDKKGFSIIELLVIFIIIFILAGISCKVVYSVVQRAKVVSAKAQISQLALLMEKVKEDTSYYCVNLSDILNEKTNPPTGQEKGWNGPYIEEGNNPKLFIDPWGNQYYYKIPPTTIFPPTQITRKGGSPEWEYFSFSAIPGPATLRVENYELTSCTIWLNGQEIVPENEFKKSPVPQIIIKNVTLLANNTLAIWARSGPQRYCIVSISGFQPIGTYFIIGSYGKDGQYGGKGFNKDIEWKSDTYPHFQ